MVILMRLAIRVAYTGAIFIVTVLTAILRSIALVHVSQVHREVVEFGLGLAFESGASLF